MSKTSAILKMIKHPGSFPVLASGQHAFQSVEQGERAGNGEVWECEPNQFVGLIFDECDLCVSRVASRFRKSKAVIGLFWLPPLSIGEFPPSSLAAARPNPARAIDTTTASSSSPARSIR